MYLWPVLTIISPPWIGHPWTFQLSHHHRLCTYGRLSYFTIIDYHLWTFQLIHPHRLYIEIITTIDLTSMGI